MPVNLIVATETEIYTDMEMHPKLVDVQHFTKDLTPQSKRLPWH